VIGCFGLTEPDFGSNPGGMITTRGKPQALVLNGAKMWITNGSTAKVAIIWAKTGRSTTPRASALHRADRHAGLQREGPEGQAVAPGVDTSELVLEDVKLGRTRCCRARRGSRARSAA